MFDIIWAIEGWAIYLAEILQLSKNTADCHNIVGTLYFIPSLQHEDVRYVLPTDFKYDWGKIDTKKYGLSDVIIYL